MTAQGVLFEEYEPDISKSQWYTPVKIAERMVDWALKNKRSIKKILEPCAGQGALVQPMLKYKVNVYAVEIDPRNVEVLPKHNRNLTVILGDFLNQKLPRTDICIMNPPYEGGNDAKFIMKSFESASIVIALLRGVVFHGVDRWETLWKHVDIIREVRFIERPFKGALQDFTIVELVERDFPRKRGEASPVPSIEWW